MIIFDLTCNLGHAFEGWFQSLENYEDQIAQELISCPHCGSIEIRRVPSAIHVSKSVAAKDINAKKAQVSSEEMLSLLGQVLSSIIASTEDVGTGFADEARRIHYLESPERPIRGEASFEEFESLRDEGIEVMMLPTLKKEEVH